MSAHRATLLLWPLALSGVQAGGFIGHGISMCQPPCAYGCQTSASAPLNCTVADMGSMGQGDSSKLLLSGDGWVVAKEPTPECKAGNDFYLQTVALCLETHCRDTAPAELEAFWAREIVKAPGPGYMQTRTSIVEPPNRTLNRSMLLNYTAKVDSEEWLSNYNALAILAVTETLNARYGLVVFLAGVIIPITLSFLRFLPWPALWTARFRAYYIDPPLLGTKHAAPVLGFAIMPTRGQAVFIAYIWLINIVLSFVEHKTVWPHPLYTSLYQEAETHVAHRLGILSVANLPLLILYAGRNNLLLWLTNWSHSTFLLLHRWIAFICMFQALAHTCIHLHVYTSFACDYYNWEGHVHHWYCGIIAGLAMVVITPASIQPTRHRVYEIFLVSHITLALLALIGCYLHVNFRFNRIWGHENWLHIAVAIWAFDRVVRLARSVSGGIKRAHISDIDDDYLRIDIPGVTATGHVYLHFPTVSTWRIWENHPFSVAGVTRRIGTVEEGPSATTVGSVLFIRKYSGITSRLSGKGSGEAGLLVLVEGSYEDKGATFLQDGHVRQSHEFPNVIWIAGGVGITGILSGLDHCRGLGEGAIGSKKLYWGARSEPLVHAVEDMLGYERSDQARRRWGDVEVAVSVRERLDIRQLLEADLGSENEGTTVVVCGPAGMADDVRAVVSAVSRHGKPVRLVVENFTW